jgi:hypothetical protein
MVGEHLIRRCRQIVQDRPLPVVGWADIPELSTSVGRRPAAWQQSRWNGADSQPSAFQTEHIPSWPLLLVSSLLSAHSVGIIYAVQLL